MSSRRFFVPSAIIITTIFNPLNTDGLSNSFPTIIDRAPSWTDLTTRTLSTTTGAQLSHHRHLRCNTGGGPPHIDATLRLFNEIDDDLSTAGKRHFITENDVRVTFYRDSAGWCPYCQKVWLVLEEKRIPYKVKTVPLNAYGDKPAWFTRLVDGGKLPVIEIDGMLVTESFEIIKILDKTFPDYGPKMFPADDDDAPKNLIERMKYLLRLEKELQSAWFSLVFYPVEGDALQKARNQLIDTLSRVDDALASKKTSTTEAGVDEVLLESPWFLGGSSPSFVDIQYITHMERIVASALYWKGLSIRGGADDKHKFHHLEKWFLAFESRRSYLATKSDYYTLVMSIPSQNGPGYFIDDAKEVSSKICGLDGAWNLPLDYDVLSSFQKGGNNDEEESHRHEAAFALTQKHEAIVSFATRGAGEPGRPSFHAELADPYAEPNESYTRSVDICLRHVTAALLDGVDIAETVASKDLKGQAGDGTLRQGWDQYEDKDGRTYWWNDETGYVRYQSAPTQQLDTCLEYLRDRVGVPRDMREGAAMQLRAHLNWIIILLRFGT